MFKKLFIDHPATVDETYGEHMGMAFSFGFRMVWAGLACLMHGLVPGLFVKTGSNMIRELHVEMVTNRNRKLQSQPGPADALTAACL